MSEIDKSIEKMILSLTYYMKTRKKIRVYIHGTFHPGSQKNIYLSLKR